MWANSFILDSRRALYPAPNGRVRKRTESQINPFGAIVKPGEGCYDVLEPDAVDRIGEQFTVP